MELKQGGELEKLIEEVREISISPQDQYEVAAIIESIGYNDNQVSELFGNESIFDLATVVFDAIYQKTSYQSFPTEQVDSFTKSFLEVVRSFLRGMIFALPMVVSVFSMLQISLSLWSYEYLPNKYATSIAIGTVLSFISIGGFTQIIARRGFFYMNQGFLKIARETTNLFIKVGYIFCIVVAILLVIANFIWRFMPTYLMVVLVLYYLFLSAIWLSTTVMYILKREFVFTGLIIIGIGMVYFLFRFLNFFIQYEYVSVIIAQTITLPIIALLGRLLIRYFFRRAEEKKEPGIEPEFPRYSILLHTLKPYFLYGILYFTFLFVDRLNAWSAHEGGRAILFFWFKGEYELGLDFALLMFIVPMGLAEVAVHKFMTKLDYVTKYVSNDTDKEINKMYFSLYIRSMITVFISAILSSLAVYWLVKWMSKDGTLLNSQLQLFPITNFVLVWGLVSYGLLSIGLTNGLILFSLSQPKPIIKAISIGLAVNFIVGFICSRAFAHYYAVIGLFVGTLLYVAITLYYLFRTIKKFDYHIYYIT